MCQIWPLIISKTSSMNFLSHLHPKLSKFLVWVSFMFKCLFKFWFDEDKYCFFFNYLTNSFEISREKTEWFPDYGTCADKSEELNCVKWR